jgi:hypothetical protein
MSFFRKAPKAENILKTKGKKQQFYHPKAENLLKINQLFAIQKNG